MSDSERDTVGMEDDLLLRAPELRSARQEPNFIQRINYNREYDVIQSNRIPGNWVNENNIREDFRLGTIEADRIRQEMQDRQRIADMSPYNREHDRQAAAAAIIRMRETRGGRTNKRNKRHKRKTKRRTKKTKRRTNKRK